MTARGPKLFSTLTETWILLLLVTLKMSFWTSFPLSFLGGVPHMPRNDDLCPPTRLGRPHLLQMA